MKTPDEKHKGWNLYWLTLLSVIFILPLIAILALMHGVQPSMPLSFTLGLSWAALLVMLQGASAAPGRGCYIRLACALWFFIAGFIVLYFARKTVALERLILASAENFALLMLIVFLARKLFATSDRFNEKIAFTSAALGLLLGQIGIACLVFMTVDDLPYVYDPVLYRFDDMLGLGWTNVFGIIVSESHLFKKFCLIAYAAPTYWIILGAISEARHNKARQTTLMLQFLLSSAFAYPLYHLMPALAPAYFFGHLFPNHLPPVQTVPDHFVSAPAATLRNTVPSLHATWALLVFLALRNSPFWHRVLGFVLVIGTLFATLGFGEHYAVDWVVACPFVAFVRGTCAFSVPMQNVARQYAIVSGLALISLWVVAIRASPASLAHPFLIQALGLCSVFMSALSEYRLARAERAEYPASDGDQRAHLGIVHGF